MKYTLWTALCCCLLTTSCSFFRADSKYLYEATEAAEEISLPEGSLLEFELRSNPTTGYRWVFTSSDEDILELDDIFYLPPENGLAGSGGQTVCRFYADEEGCVTVTARYYRPWQEFDPETDREITWQVEVTEEEAE